jgi:hypothetical protein
LYEVTGICAVLGIFVFLMYVLIKGLTNLNNNNDVAGGSVGGNSARNKECCSICPEPFSVGDTVVRLKKDANATNTDRGASHHFFHEDCILEWLQNHNDCRLCRLDMINTQTNV